MGCYRADVPSFIEDRPQPATRAQANLKDFDVLVSNVSGSASATLSSPVKPVERSTSLRVPA